jgi:hypothetical protein
MKIEQLRQYVRDQLDLPEEDDLPTSQIDLYLAEGFQRTIQQERRWPFYEKYWTVSNENDRSIDLPDDMSGIASLIDQLTGHRLVQVAHELAEDNIPSEDLGIPEFFTVWGDRIFLWPKPTSDRVYQMRGWRKPVDLLDLLPSQEPDCDERLHLPLIAYACSMAYAQQEDEVLTQLYNTRWTQGVEIARNDIMRAQHHRPLVLNAGLRRGRLSPLFQFMPNQTY